MKRAEIAIVAEWTGWCGRCAAERPLVLTRTGRRGVRDWFAARSAPDEVLTLTCRLCGVRSVVPEEADDPEILLVEDPPAALSCVLPITLTAAPQPPDDEAPTTALNCTPATTSGPVPAVVPDPLLVPATAVEAALDSGHTRAGVDDDTRAGVPAPAATEDATVRQVPVFPGVPVVPQAITAMATAAPLVAAPELNPLPVASPPESPPPVAPAPVGLVPLGPLPVTPPVTALPSQRGGAPPQGLDGIDALQMLAEGMDLGLSSSHS